MPAWKHEDLALILQHPYKTTKKMPDVVAFVISPKVGIRGRRTPGLPWWPAYLGSSRPQTVLFPEERTKIDRYDKMAQMFNHLFHSLV